MHFKIRHHQSTLQKQSLLTRVSKGIIYLEGVTEYVMWVKNGDNLQCYSATLACYYFIDTDRRHKTPRSETKGLGSVRGSLHIRAHSCLGSTQKTFVELTGA